MPVSSEEFRAGLSRWVSGVTIVTSRAGERVHGMTVSAFASVSLRPPQVLVCADTASNTHALIAESGVFAANVLARGQEELSTRFALKEWEDRRFEGLAWESGATGAPWIPGALAVLDCRVASAHDAGDHVIYVGSVEALRARDGEPLVYYRGGYRHLAAVTGGGA